MIEADVIVIGAGPAGIAATRTVADSGLHVLLLDEQKHAGGQIYRDVERAAPERGAILGDDYTKGIELVSALRHPGIQHIRDAVVWKVDKSARITFTSDGKAAMAQAQRLVVATGALERPMPISGWTLPGVMTAGAAQILLKQSGMVCERAVLVGSGPLLYLVAAQMCRAGTPPLALVETQSMADLTSSLRHGLGALRGWRYLVKGLSLIAEIRRAGVKRYTAARRIVIEGDGQAESVRFVYRGQSHRIACANVLLHHGVVPNTQIARSIGIQHYWHPRQRVFVPKTDKWGRTEVPEVFIVGDGAGIGGARSAEIAGRISGLAMACDLAANSPVVRDTLAVPLFRMLAGEMAARPFIDGAYPPFAEALAPSDDTIVCRCEEVTAGDIRGYATIGCDGPNQTKAFGRSGMGPCQGRYCGLAVTELLATAHGRAADDIGYYRIRPPLKPVTLGEIAAAENLAMRESEKEAAE